MSRPASSIVTDIYSTATRWANAFGTASTCSRPIRRTLSSFITESMVSLFYICKLQFIYHKMQQWCIANLSKRFIGKNSNAFMMRSKEPITRREMEALLILAREKNQSAEAIAAKFKKKIDRTGIWKILDSLIKKALIGSTSSPLPPNPRGGCCVINRYFILDDAYDDIYKEIKRRKYEIVPVIEEKFVVSHPFPPGVDRLLPGEDIMDFTMRTGFVDLCQAKAFKEYFTDVRRATDEEVALYNILKHCSPLLKEKEESEIEYNKFSNGYSYGPCFAGLGR